MGTNLDSGEYCSLGELYDRPSLWILFTIRIHSRFIYRKLNDETNHTRKSWNSCRTDVRQ
jgi:hypothetical protein